MRRNVCLISLLLFLAGCTGSGVRGRPDERPVEPLRIVIDPVLAAAGPAQSHEGVLVPHPAAARGDRPLWTRQLNGHQAFLEYSTPVRGIPFSKFVIRPDDGEVYYFWTAAYPFHYNFVTEVLLPLMNTPAAAGRNSHDGQGVGSTAALPAGSFNLVGWDRAFLLGSISFQDGVHGFEFLEADTPSEEMLRFTYRRLRETFTGVDLRFRPIARKQQILAEQVRDVPSVGADFLDGTRSFQCLNEGTAVGRLRLLEPGEDAGRLLLDPHEIVVLREVPLDITPVAGILTARLTTPLSHVNLRATAWGIPNAGQVGAEEQVRPLRGQLVHYSVRFDGWTLREASEAERLAYEARLRPGREVRPLLVPPADLSYRGLPELRGLSAQDVSRVGAKAANLGVLATRGSAERYAVPPGLVLPFAYYNDHLLAHGLHRQVKQLLDDPALREDETALRARLVELQQAIRTSRFDPGLEEQLLLRVRYLLGRRGLFVRSSTNAEDLPGFNGAGLYDTVPNVEADREVIAAIQQVWASLWNYRAFQERERAGIDHRSVYPAVILQVGVDADAAGVLVTRDLIHPGKDSGMTINAKRGLGLRVVDGHSVPEQVLFDEERNRIQVISRSEDDVALRFDEHGGVREVASAVRQPVLSEERVHRLVAAAQEVRTLFVAGPLDLEWLFAGEELFLVQARPYVLSPPGAPRP